MAKKTKIHFPFLIMVIVYFIIFILFLINPVVNNLGVKNFLTKKENYEIAGERLAILLQTDSHIF